MFNEKINPTKFNVNLLFPMKAVLAKSKIRSWTLMPALCAGVQILSFLLFFYYVFFNENLFAAEERTRMTTGPEFEFTSSALDELDDTSNGALSDYLKQEIIPEIVARCERQNKKAIERKTPIRCEVDARSRTIKYTYTNGDEVKHLTVFFNTDPGVIEIQTSPLTTADSDFWKETIQKNVFKFMSKHFNLNPGTSSSAGHIHIGLKSAFANDTRLFKNFLTDLYNHPEFFLSMYQDTRNAPHICDYEGKEGSAMRKKLKQILQEFDADPTKTASMGISGLVREIRESVYTKTIDEGERRVTKYQSVNLDHIIDPDGKEVAEDRATLEIRSIPGQSTFNDFILMTKLFEKRIAMIKDKMSKDSNFKIEYANVGNICSEKWSDKHRKKVFTSFLIETGITDKAEIDQYLTILQRKLSSVATDDSERPLIYRHKQDDTKTKAYKLDTIINNGPYRDPTSVIMQQWGICNGSENITNNNQ